MKSKLIFIFMAISTIAILGSFNKSNSLSSDLLFNNIEALANPESASYVCYGNGSLDCPLNNSKVAGIIKMYGTGF